MPNPVVHWEIMSNDKSKGEELQRFYSELFGWKIDADNPYSYGVVDTQTDRGIPGAVTMAMFSDPDGHITGLIKGSSR